jgi:glycosidase
VVPQRVRPARRGGSRLYYFHDAAHTTYETWLDAATLPKFDWNSAELRRRFIEGPDSVVARWLAEPYGIDGWRIDVANMTGRLGAEDLNAVVRQTVRRTMIEVSSDTLLLAESTNDAASDLQGDAWHGGMTYPAFTRGVWSWLASPDASLTAASTAASAMRCGSSDCPPGCRGTPRSSSCASSGSSPVRFRGVCSAGRCRPSTPTTPPGSPPTPRR